MSRRQGQIPFSEAQWQDKERWAQTGVQEVLSKHEEKHLQCLGDWALGQVALRGCGVSFYRHIQILSGHNPVQSAIDEPALAWGLERMISRGHFQSWPSCAYVKVRL